MNNFKKNLIIKEKIYTCIKLDSWTIRTVEIENIKTGKNKVERQQGLYSTSCLCLQWTKMEAYFHKMTKYGHVILHLICHNNWNEFHQTINASHRYHTASLQLCDAYQIDIIFFFISEN